jgi:hypothetical protein
MGVPPLHQGVGRAVNVACAYGKRIIALQILFHRLPVIRPGRICTVGGVKL